MKRLLLLISLCGFMAQAMEPLIIKDINGAQLELTEAQRNALGQCKTFKNILAAYDSQTIDFEGIPAPVIKEDLEQLAFLIEDPKKISEKLTKVSQNKIIPLFKLADYLHAPKEVGAALAEKVEGLIAPRIAELEKLMDESKSLNDAQVAEYADLQAQWQSVQKYLGISMSKWLEKTKGRSRRLSPEGHILVDLSGDPKFKNKLRRLNGIEKIERPHSVMELNLDNHNITSVDIASLRKMFPRLYKVSLKNNRIEKIAETEKIRRLEVNLKGNPLKSITIKNPERSNYVTFKTDKPDVKINFVQDKWAKSLTWLKSLNAKSKIACEYFLPPRETFFVPILAGVAWGYMSLCHEDVLRSMLAENPNQEVAVLDDVIFSAVSTDLPIDITYNIAYLLFKICQYRGINDLVVHHVPLKDAFEKFQIPHQSGYLHKLSSCGWYAGKAALLYATIGAGIGAIVTLPGLFTGRFSNLSQRYARRNPYRIRVQSGDAIIQDFPSNYTYNLFGKI